MRVYQMTENYISFRIILLVFILCLLPLILNILGVSFASPAFTPFKVSDYPTTIDTMFHALSGGMVHALMEWSSVSIAIFNVTFCFVHYFIKRDITVPILGMAFLSSGLMDGYHTLAAMRLISASAETGDFIPFTWALSRMFHAFIMISCVLLLLIMRPKDQHLDETTDRKVHSAIFITGSVFLFLLATAIFFTSTAQYLPKTIFPDAVISRPYDIMPLSLFIIATPLFWLLYKKTKSLFCAALLIGLIPEILLGSHMSFGSTRLFDNHFNIAHYLKVIAFLVPFAGLMIDYYKDNVRIVRLNKKLLIEQEKNKILNSQLEERVIERTSQLQEEVTVRQQKEKELNTAYVGLQAAQDSLLQKEKMAALGGLVAGVAHEVNTPLGISVTAISEIDESLSDLHKKYTAKTMSKKDLNDYLHNTQEAVTILNSNLRRATHLIKSFKQVAVDQSDEEIRDIDVKDYLDDVILSIKPKLKRKGHKITVDCPESLLMTTNPGALAQVLTNLINNSLIHAFTDHNIGEINIAVSELDHDKVKLLYMDNGRGIDVEIQDKIFEPFVTTKRANGGTGLGLHILFNLVTGPLMGEVNIHEITKKGSCFKIILPKHLI